jgi:hypothetical protein
VLPLENLALKASVTTSSASSGQEGSKARDGVVDGWPGDWTKEWATVSGGAGSWIRYGWSAGVNVSCVWLYDRINTNDQITAGSLTFSNGDPPITVGALFNDGSVVKQCFPTKTNITWVKFTVTGVSASTQNAGLAELEIH